MPITPPTPPLLKALFARKVHFFLRMTYQTQVLTFFLLSKTDILTLSVQVLLSLQIFKKTMMKRQLISTLILTLFSLQLNASNATSSTLRQMVLAREVKQTHVH